MTGDLREKYYRINLDFPPIAGKIDQCNGVQRRLISRLAMKKQDEETKALLISVAESIEVSELLVKYSHKMFKGVVEDINALLEGATLRNTIKWQSDVIEGYLNHK